MFDYELLDLALLEPKIEDKIGKLESLLLDEPYFADAQIALMDLKCQDSYDILREVELAIINQMEFIEIQGVNPVDDAGDYYAILETRPLMRLLYKKLIALLDVSFFAEAHVLGLYMIYLNRNDNMGVRYIIANLLAFMASYGDILEFISDWDEESLEFEFALISGALKEGNTEIARMHLQNFNIDTEALEEALELVYQGVSEDGYELHSSSHYLNIFNLIPFQTNIDVLQWIQDSLNNVKN